MPPLSLGRCTANQIGESNDGIKRRGKFVTQFGKELRLRHIRSPCFLETRRKVHLYTNLRRYIAPDPAIAANVPLPSKTGFPLIETKTVSPQLFVRVCTFGKDVAHPNHASTVGELPVRRPGNRLPSVSVQARSPGKHWSRGYRLPRNR